MRGVTGASQPSGRETVVLDTCVLLSDPHAFFKFPGCDVVVPLTVVEELDSHKSRMDDVGKAARTAIRNLEEARLAGGGRLHEPVGIGDGSTLRIEVNGLRLDSIRKLSLDSGKPDNRILAAALGLREEAAGEVRVVTQDAALRVKAAQVGLNVDDYSTSGKLAARTAVEIHVTEDAMRKVAAGTATTADVPGVEDLPPNTPLVLRGPTGGSLLATRNGSRIRRIRPGISAWGLKPRSKEQTFALGMLMDPGIPIVALTGPAGTGKTLLAVAAGLEQVFEEEVYDRLMVLRPVIPVGRQDLGFLPGTVEEKLSPWFDALVDALVALGGAGSDHRTARRQLDAWVRDGRVVLDGVTFLRGRSLQRTFVVVDEAQNLEPATAKTVITRLADGSKAVLLGDTTQIDSPWLSETHNALASVVTAFSESELFAHLHLSRCERSPAASLAARLL